MTDLLERRYGRGAPSGILDTPVISHLLAHKSVRAFSADPVPEHLVETLVAAAQSAPTSSNLQAWSVLAVEDPVKRARLAELCRRQAHVTAAPVFLVWLADLARLRGLGAEADRPTAALDYLETFLVGVIDATLAAQNAAIAAESLGLGVVYIGAIRNHPEEVADLLGLPPLVFAAFGMCVGVPEAANAAAIKPRMPQSLALHRDVYRFDPAAPELDVYDEDTAAFQRGQSLRPAGWRDPSLTRVSGPEAMSGRHRLKQALARLGFQLD